MVAASADHSASDRGFVQRLAPYLAVGLLLAVVPIAFATASLEAEQINKHGEITRQATVSMTFVVVIGVLVAAFLSAGKAVTGRLLGVLIDERNKFSLSRLQIAAWTIVALASILSLAAALVWSDAENPLGFGIPTDLLVLTGISVTTLTAASLVKGEQAKDNTLEILEPDTVQVGTDGDIEKFRAASLVDMIRGEQHGSTTTVDIGKIQALFFTAVVIVVYAFVVFNQFDSPVGSIEGLPPLTDQLLGLLGISHAGYIAKKAIPSKAAAAATAGGGENQPALGPQSAEG